MMTADKRQQPTLFIGLGGKGGKIVNRIATILKKRDDWAQLQRTMQFFALDTDKTDLDALTNINIGHRFVISGFDKSLWASEKLGRSGKSKPDADPRVAQWVHDWYNFSASQGVGAGQIRIESRISLYNCLETTDLISRLEKAILDTIDMDNANLAHEVKRFNVFIYYTVAGGTGSGSHLMFAAFLRHLISSFGWSANIIGVSMLSTLVLPLMRNMRQRGDIMANGYAAMKESEHLLRLKVFSDQRNPTNKRDFVCHPFLSSMEVNESPFDFIYVMDTNPEVYIKDFETSVADGIYLQLFTPIFGRRNSDYDNFEKNQKRLSRGLYSTFYGSYGCSVLLLPDKELFDYCTRRKTADLISEQLLVKLSLILPAGEKSYNATTDELNRCSDTGKRDELWDDKFVRYMHDRVSEQEGTVGAATASRDGLKRHGAALFDAGFALELDRKNLRKAVAGISEKPLNDDDKRRVAKVLVCSVDDESELARDDEGGFVAAAKPNIHRNLLPFIFNYHGFGSGIAGTVRLDGQGNESSFSDGLFRKFWDHLDENYCKAVREEFQHAAHKVVAISDSAKESGPARLESVIEELRESVKADQRKLGDVRDKVKRRTAEANISINRRLVLSFLAKELKPFEIQRLFVVTQLELSRGYCVALEKIFEALQLRLDEAFAELRNFENTVAGNDELRKASKVEVRERVEEMRHQTGAADFQRSVAQLDDKIRRRANRLEAMIYLQFVLDMHKKLVEVLVDLSSVYRSFSREAEEAIKTIEKEAEAIRKSPGGQSDAFHNDIEALQDFHGDRMWGDYYAAYVRHVADIPEQKLHEIIAEAFIDERLNSAGDRLDAIGKRTGEIIGAHIKPMIIGDYKEGREKRGLTLQDALVREAQLKYRARLLAIGRLDQETNACWEKVVSTMEAKLHSRSERDMAREMRDFAARYLATKIAVGVRRSAIMATIAMQDSEVTEYACRQSIICYDTTLYGDGGDESDRLAFPKIVKSIAPEFMEEHFAEHGKMAIFYQAILGVPPFVFRNLVTGMKEAYNTRVGERNLTQPLKGRQYPLHIDRNWEPGDLGVDETRLPLSLDPEEAVQAYRSTNEGYSRFFSYWYAFFRAGHIVRDEGRGFIVPSGKLGNAGQDIVLGATAREAIVAMLRSQTAHATLEDAFRKAEPVEKGALKAHRDRCRELMGGDAWGQTSPDPEIRELADLLDNYLKFIQEEEEEAARRRKHAESYHSGFGKKN